MDKLRVWWIPQAGATEGAFYVPVKTVEEGKKVMEMILLLNSCLKIRIYNF